VTNALGYLIEVTAYDFNGRPLSLIDPNGPVTIFTYDPAGQLTRLTLSAGSNAKTYIYDANGSITGDGAGQTFTYDARGRLSTVTVAGATTTYRLDPLGQRIRKTGTARQKGPGSIKGPTFHSTWTCAI
jgi:YD repeat-containing protein